MKTVSTSGNSSGSIDMPERDAGKQRIQPRAAQEAEQKHRSGTTDEANDGDRAHDDARLLCQTRRCGLDAAERFADPADSAARAGRHDLGRRPGRARPACPRKWPEDLLRREAMSHPKRARPHACEPARTRR